MTLNSLSDAIAFCTDTMAAHPERDGLAARIAALEGQRREYPAFSLGHLSDPADTDEPVVEFDVPEVQIPDPTEAQLAREVLGLLKPLDMLNPVRPVLGLGSGTGTMATAFGIPLDPAAGNSPAFTRRLDDVLAEPPPDPETAGLMPDMLERVSMLKDHLPTQFRIGLPDMQGVFNVAHAVLGEEALTAPYLEPDKFHAFMDRMATLWIETRKLLLDRIGPESIDPTECYARIAECSVNLVSPAFYTEHILPYDRRIAEAFGPLQVHTCSGPHVFHVTLRNLPVIATEAGFIAKTAAGHTPVQEALDAIGDRPMLLNLGQELPQGLEYETIRRDLDLYERTPRLMFGYTGMHWRIKDRPLIRDLHRRLDDYWRGKYN